MRDIQNKLASVGLDRVENFVFLAWAVALFVTTGGFWFGLSVCSITVYLTFGFSLLLAAIVSWRWAARFLLLCGVCLAASMYTFSYCGIDASVCHVPMQRLLNEGWNPVLHGTLEKLTELTGGDISVYHTLCMPKTVQLTGALIAKATGLYVADTCVHYFLIYVVFAAAFRFAVGQWECGRLSAAIFGAVIAFNSQIGTMMGSSIDYPQYGCIATAVLSLFTWRRMRKSGDMFLAIVCFALVISIKPQGFFLGLIGLLLLLMCNLRNPKAPWIVIAVAIFVLLTASCPYITIWVRYGSPFYPTHSFDPSVRLVDITEDFASNADGASMGYFARIIYAWFSTKLSCLGCAWWQGKDTFNPEFYVPVGVDGLKVWFRVLMWLAVGGLVLSKKNRVTVLCMVVFVMMNVAPLRYIGFGRYFMLIWIIPPLAMYNLAYDPIKQIGVVMKYAKFGICAVLCGLAALVAVKTSWLWLRNVGMEGARQIVFDEAAQKGVTAFVPNRPWRGYSVKERYFNVMANHMPCGNAHLYGTVFDECLPEGFSCSPDEVRRDFPRCDTPHEFLEFRYDKMLSRLPRVLWEKR